MDARAFLTRRRRRHPRVRGRVQARRLSAGRNRGCFLGRGEAASFQGFQAGRRRRHGRPPVRLAAERTGRPRGSGLRLLLSAERHTGDHLPHLRPPRWLPRAPAALHTGEPARSAGLCRTERGRRGMTKFSARRLMLGAVAALAAIIQVAPGRAETYPSRPITVIVPFAGGSASDVVTRIMLNKMSANMGQPIVVENRPGAGGNIGTAYGAKAAPDGYTWIASGSGPMAANKTLYHDLGYDPEKDFEAVSPFAFFTIVVVASTKLPVKSLQELIAYAKQH